VIVREHPDGAVVAVRAVPGASVAGVLGRHGDELRIRVCSPPVDGRANDEICAVLAKALGLRARSVTLVAGHASRSKQLLVDMPCADVAHRLAPWIGPNEAVGG